jgi:hypothetical protein
VSNPHEATDSSDERKCTLPLTVSVLREAINMLRAAAVAAASEPSGEPIYLFRALSNIALPNDFIKTGGGEVGFMSATSDKSVMMAYASGGSSGCNTVFKLCVPGLESCGVSISAFSCLPGDAEYVFPPLTYLRPTGKSDYVGKTAVVEVTPVLTV